MTPIEALRNKFDRLLALKLIISDNSEEMIKEFLDGCVVIATEAIKKWEDSSGKVTGMKLVKASERLPEDYEPRFCYNRGVRLLLYHNTDRWIDYDSGALYLMDSDTENNKIEWLDESVSPYKDEETWTEQNLRIVFDAGRACMELHPDDDSYDDVHFNNCLKIIRANPPYKEEETSVSAKNAHTEITTDKEEVRKNIIAILNNTMYDFDYGYSKENGLLNIKMVDRNKASYKLADLFFASLPSHPPYKEISWNKAIKEATEQYKPTGVHASSQILEYIRKQYSLLESKEEVDKEWKWTDDLVKKYAEIYRFSSSRTSIEQFKKNPDWIVQAAADRNYDVAILESKEKAGMKDHEK